MTRGGVLVVRLRASRINSELLWDFEGLIEVYVLAIFSGRVEFEFKRFPRVVVLHLLEINVFTSPLSVHSGVFILRYFGIFWSLNLF